ncbi:MAG: ferritin-like domain-containing protein [Bdellovibrionota bacterium]
MANEKIVECLNEILEHELAGVVRYTHYALMVFGHNRIPICSWLRTQAQESLAHADQVGEHITSLEGHPSLRIGKLLESNTHRINDILKESLDHEKGQVALYIKLLGIVQDKSIMLEEFARTMIAEEEVHISEVQKMLRESK